MAPEVMEQVTGYDYKADIWSFGITAIELASGTAPYHKYPPMKVLMLTLQNEPPSLDSGAEDKEQYKQYGKTFRKMISECLQKDPSKRPTATELLKHQFFKNKARDRKFLQQTLVALGPTIDARVAKVKNAQDRAARKPGSSGKFTRNQEGEWQWESDDDDLDNDGRQPAAVQPSSAPAMAAAAAPAFPAAAHNPNQQQPAVPVQVAQPPRPLSVVLRMRNPTGELNDIRFEYQPSKDTTEGIANELLYNKLINPSDVKIMADSMRQLIENTPLSRVITFRVSTGFNPDTKTPEAEREKSLEGYAQLSLAPQ